MTQSNEQGLSKRTLRSILARWERDYAQMESVYGEWDAETEDAYTETMRNLGTAIVWIQAMIASKGGTPAPPPKAA